MFHVDALSLLFALIALLVLLVSWPGAEDHPNPGRRAAAWLLLAGGLVGLAFAAELAVAWLFVELCALALAGLLTLPGTLRSLFAALGFLRWSLVGSMLAVVGIGLLLAVTGSGAPSTALDAQPWLSLGLWLVVLGFGAKALLLPLNLWGTWVSRSATAEVLVPIAGLLPALVLVSLARLLPVDWGEGALTMPLLAPLLVLGLVTALVGSLSLWRARTFPEFAFQFSVAASGLTAVAFALPGPAGRFLGIALALHTLLVQLGLFVLARRWRGHLRDLTGIARRLPLIATLLALLGASAIGVPPLPGFWARVMLVLGLAETQGDGGMIALLLVVVAAGVQALAWLRLLYLLQAPPLVADVQAEAEPRPPRADRRPELLIPGWGARAILFALVALLLLASLGIAPMSVLLNQHHGAWPSLSPIDWLLLSALATLLLALVFGRWRRLAPLFPLAYGIQFWALTRADLLGAEPQVASFVLRVLRQPVEWRYDSLGWLFALLSIGAAFVCALFAVAGRLAGAHAGAVPSARSWHLFQVALALCVLSALLLFGSGNLLALYLGWELVLWSLVLLLAVGGALNPLLVREFLLAGVGGGLALLGALALLLHLTGSLEFGRGAAQALEPGAGQMLLLGGLLILGIGSRLMILPRWQAPVAAASHPPALVYWHGAGASAGFFVLLMVLAEITGLAVDSDRYWPRVLTFADFRLLLCWAAAGVALLASWRAVREERPDALLNWLALGQTGAVVLAFLLGGPRGLASGLLLVFALGLARTVLAAVCVFGVPGLSGQCAARRGWVLLAIAVAAASLVGLPPTLGFVGKWLLYAAVLGDTLLGWSRWPVLAATLLGAGLSLLAVIRLAGLLTAGRSRPVSITSDAALAPVLGLTALTLLAGVLPAPALGWVTAIGSALGMEALGGDLVPRWIGLGQFAVLALALALWWWWRQLGAGGPAAA